MRAASASIVRIASAAAAILLVGIITAIAAMGAAGAVSGANQIERDAMALSGRPAIMAADGASPAAARSLSAAAEVEQAASEQQQAQIAPVAEAAPIAASVSSNLVVAETGSPAPRTPASGTVTIFGTEIPYVNAYGATTAPESTAGLWEGTDSVDDGSYAYFIGHHPGVFNGVMDLRAGDEVTVCDRSGAIRTYTVFKVFDVTNTTTWDQVEAEVTSHGESVILQTCVGDGCTYRIVECK